MNTRILALIGAAAVLATGIGQAGAQQSSAGSMMQQGQQGRMMQQGASEQTGPGMMGPGMMGPGMMGAGMMGRHMGGRMGHGAMMPFLFAIMDADGDGALTLAEVQEIHARIFRHVDADDDGKVTQAEIKAFFRRGRDADALEE